MEKFSWQQAFVAVALIAGVAWVLTQVASCAIQGQQQRNELRQKALEKGGSVFGM